MQHLLYELHYFDNPNFPIIFHVNHLRRVSSEILPHWHANIELLYVISGKIAVTIDDQRVIAKRGEISIVNSNAMHSIVSLSEESTYFCLIMDSNFCKDLSFDTLNCTFRNLTNDLEMRNIFQIIANEAHHAKPYYQTAIKALCNTMLILLFRNQLIECHADQNLNADKFTFVRNTIEYIHENYKEDISLDEISLNIGLSKFYMCRVFKEVTHITVSQYIHHLRCHQAHALLSSNKMSIAKVSEHCGFNSTAYFSKCFKDHFGYPPSQVHLHKNHPSNKEINVGSTIRNKNVPSVFKSTDGEDEPVRY